MDKFGKMFGEIDCKVIIQNGNYMYLECMGVYKRLVEIKICFYWYLFYINVFLFLDNYFVYV